MVMVKLDLVHRFIYFLSIVSAFLAIFNITGYFAVLKKYLLLFKGQL